VDELVTRKRQGAEKMALSPNELALHERHLDRLEIELREAHERSKLPEQARTADALEDFVIRLRLARATTLDEG
jgi:hypothetical protein